MLEQAKGHNEALRRAREQRHWSRDELVSLLRQAGWAGVDVRALSRYEAGLVRRPQYQARRALIAVFQTPLSQLGFTLDHENDTDQQPSPTPEPAPPVQAPGTQNLQDGHEERDDMRRRTFSAGMVGLSLAATTSEVAAAAITAGEAVRHGLMSTSGNGVEDDVTEWEALALESSSRHGAVAPLALLQSYLADLHQLNIALSGQDRETAKDLYRVAAVLTSLTAWTYSNLGSGSEADRWWRTAHRMASISHHEATQVWVASQHGLMAIYRDDYRPEAILTMLERAEHLARMKSVAVSPGAAYFYSCKAQTLGMLGRAAEAEVALERLREISAALDNRTDFSMVGWSSSRLAFVESFTYSHLGNYQRAVAAQQRAVHLTPTSAPLHRLKMDLQRSLCLAKTGANTDAVQHAVQALSCLPEAQHDLPIADLARTVLRSIPRTRLAGSATDELQRYVTRRAINA